MFQNVMWKLPSNFLSIKRRRRNVLSNEETWWGKIFGMISEFFVPSKNSRFFTMVLIRFFKISRKIRIDYDTLNSKRNSTFLQVGRTCNFFCENGKYITTSRIFLSTHPCHFKIRKILQRIYKNSCISYNVSDIIFNI